MEDLATLVSICKEAGITPRWYHELTRRRLVPGWQETRSLGRGRGRRYLYSFDAAMHALQLIKNEQAAGRTIDEIARLHGRWWTEGREHFGGDEAVDDMLRSLVPALVRHDVVRFRFCFESAFNLGAFADFHVFQGQGGLRVQFRDEGDRESFIAELRMMREIFQAGRPGDAVLRALVRKKLRDVSFETALAPGTAAGENEAAALSQRRESLERREHFWAGDRKALMPSPSRRG